MIKSEITLTVVLICVGITIFPAIAPIAAGQRMGPGMMYGYGPGYGFNTTGFQAGYGPGYWMGPGMMYGYGQGDSTSIADELSKLASLKKEGVITQGEYDKLKNRLIG
jgi:hypothetical protein